MAHYIEMTWSDEPGDWRRIRFPHNTIREAYDELADLQQRHNIIKGLYRGGLNHNIVLRVVTEEKETKHGQDCYQEAAG